MAAEAVSSGEQAIEQDDDELTNDKTETLDKWLLALKEDLASWISRLLKIEVTVDNFISVLSTGVVPCKLANFIQNIGQRFFKSNPKCKIVFPRVGVTFKERGAFQGSFIARDNVSNFIRWCREIGVPDVIMFETEDLVSSRNEKAVLLTLLEVARRVFKVGVDPPELVRLENEIDKELQNEPEPPLKAEPILTALKKKHKSHSLDDLVYEVQKKCTCPTMYPVQRISDGKYQMGGSRNLIFVRVMRKHVMVRVGGGWDTLDRYFEKHDPCRFVAANRRTSKSARPSSGTQQVDPFARSPSSASMASLSSTESYESTGTTSASPSAGCRQTRRTRTASGGTNSPTYDRCLSPRRGSRHKSPCNRSTPPRTTIQTTNRLTSSRSMSDLQNRRMSEPVGLSSSLPVPRHRPSSAHRPSTAPGSQAASTTPGQRRKSVAVTPRRDVISSTNQSNKKQPANTRMHHRSKSMQDLSKAASQANKTAIPTASPRKSRPASARTRSSSVTPDRSKSEGPRSAVPSTRRASTSQATRKGSTSASPRRRPPVTGSPMNSPRTNRRSSSTPRGTYSSPANSPRITRKKTSTSKDPVLVNSPDPMRRAISNLSSPPSRRVPRSASFGSKDDISKELLSNGTGKRTSPRQQGISGIPRPRGTSSPSKLPIKVPGKQTTPKKQPLSKQKPLTNGTTKTKSTKVTSQEQQLPPADPYEDIPTPFDNFSYTSDTSSQLSDKDDFNLIPNDFCFNSTGSTDTVKTMDLSFDGDLQSTSEYDYLDCESDLSGVKSPLSLSSSYSFSASPTKELFDTPLTEETEEVGNVGILERLKSLNVEQSSVRPTLRGKIFSDHSSSQSPYGSPPTAFLASEYKQREPEERSKFFDIEKEFPSDSTDGEFTHPESPRKFSLVSALIGSIEKRNEPRSPQKKKRSDSLHENTAASELPTEPRTGDEAVTGSQDSEQQEHAGKITDNGENVDHRRTSLDENFNVQTNGEQKTDSDMMLPQENQTFKQDGTKTTGSPKHKDLAMDSHPRRYSVEELIEDLLPSNDSGKEPAFQAII